MPAIVLFDAMNKQILEAGTPVITPGIVRAPRRGALALYKLSVKTSPMTGLALHS